jgi:hypothetical protein
LKKINFLGYQKMQIYRGRAIAMLYWIHKELKQSDGLRKSHLWSKKKNRTGIAWWPIVRDKILGPFNLKHFSTTRNYIAYWVGEKVQIIGFAYGMIEMLHNKIKKQVQH